MAMLRFYLMQYWLSLRQATNVYITRVHAPSSTKNQGNKRSSEVHQKTKGNQYYFGMKTNIDVDAEPSLVHSMVGTEAQVADVTQPTAAWRRESGAYRCPLHRGGEAARARGKPSHLANSGMTPHLKEVRKTQPAVPNEAPVRLHQSALPWPSAAQLLKLFTLSNRWMARQRLLTNTGEVLATAKSPEVGR